MSIETRRSPRLQRQQCVDMGTSDVMPPTQDFPDQLTSNHATTDHVTSNHVTHKGNLTQADQSTLKNLSTIVEDSLQDFSDLSMKENSCEGEENVGQIRSNELMREQSRRLQEILSIQEETLKILQLCKEKSKQC